MENFPRWGVIRLHRQDLDEEDSDEQSLAPTVQWASGIVGADLNLAFAPLAGSAVGQTIGNAITLDENANGYGWYIDLSFPAAGISVIQVMGGRREPPLGQTTFAKNAVYGSVYHSLRLLNG